MIKQNNFPSKFADLLISWYLKFIDLILFFDLNLKYFRSKIERENFLSTCQIFHYYDFFRLIRIQSSMMSVIKKWNWKDFDYFFSSCQIFHHCDFSAVLVQAIFSFVNNLKWKIKMVENLTQNQFFFSYWNLNLIYTNSVKL